METVSFQNILLPVDGSEGTRRAEDLAVDLATQYDASLDVLYVVDEAAVPLDTRVQQVLSAAESWGREAVDETTERASRAGVEAVSGHVRRGHPHEAILAFGEEEDVDLVVMGTHGRRGLERYLLGSVTEKVVRLSPVPVLTARIDDEADGD